jgi:hypothetical protein
MPYWERLGIALDEFLNTLLLNGDPAQTISLHAALAEQQGKRWGCWLCWILAHLVQPSHCADQLTHGATPTSAALRAGVLLIGVAGLLGTLGYFAIQSLLHFVGAAHWIEPNRINTQSGDWASI